MRLVYVSIQRFVEEPGAFLSFQSFRGFQSFQSFVATMFENTVLLLEHAPERSERPNGCSGMLVRSRWLLDHASVHPERPKRCSNILLSKENVSVPLNAASHCSAPLYSVHVMHRFALAHIYIYTYICIYIYIYINTYHSYP